MLRKGLDSEAGYQRLAELAGQARITKYQWRDALKKEGLPFNYAQIDFLFDHIATNRRVLEAADWVAAF